MRLDHRKIHQTRHPIARQDHVRRGDVPVDHPAAVHLRYRPAQLHGQSGQFIGDQRFGRPGQAGTTGIRQHHGPRIPRRLGELRHPGHTTQPLEHRHLMPRPASPVRPQGVLADSRLP